MAITLAEKVVAPQLILRLDGQFPVFLSEPWPFEGRRPSLLGRHGLWLKLTDGTTREITYSLYASHDEALAWLLKSARRSETDIAEIRYWLDDELLRFADYELRRNATHAADIARIDALLGS